MACDYLLAGSWGGNIHSKEVTSVETYGLPLWCDLPYLSIKSELQSFTVIQDTLLRKKAAASCVSVLPVVRTVLTVTSAQTRAGKWGGL